MLNIKENEILAPHTVYKIGGPARFFSEVKNSEELADALRFAKDKELPFLIMGAGSNMLISDLGFDGLVMHISGGNAVVSGESMKVDAGVMMARAVLESGKAGLSGFEWGVGIPGTIGGSVRGNAGCFGGEMKDIIASVDTMQMANGKWQIITLSNSQCEFGYRDSIFKRHPEWIILSAIFALRHGDPKGIQEEIKRITLERTLKQDIGTKSCGCIFKNVSWKRKDINHAKLLRHFPELNEFVGRLSIPASFLIDATGLKGKRVGNIFVSPKHANYFVNVGEATAEEVVMLIGIVKDSVRRKFGIVLEEEIQYFGF